jgi:hypothetical protein
MHNGILHNDPHHKGIMSDIQHNHIQHYDTQHSNSTIMLNVSFIIIMLNIVMLITLQSRLIEAESKTHRVKGSYLSDKYLSTGRLDSL